MGRCQDGIMMLRRNRVKHLSTEDVLEIQITSVRWTIVRRDVFKRYEG
jgi:hypothetical protein